MNKAVGLAEEARTCFFASRNEKNPIKIVLSLGSFGSTLSPAQEFDGYYPPPFGPRGYTPDDKNTILFVNPADEIAARDALKEFHLQRLLSFYDSRETWALIDAIAFETVPLERETWAIRMAMKEFSSHMEGSELKPWYISTVWKPGTSSSLLQDKNNPFTAVASALITGDLPLPTGLGVNCTQLLDLDAAVAGFRGFLSKQLRKPFLVMYPNGGDTYDISSRTWAGDANSDQAAASWASKLADIAKREKTSGVWSGVIVGGCCKTGPKHIQALRQALSP